MICHTCQHNICWAVLHDRRMQCCTRPGLYSRRPSTEAPPMLRLARARSRIGPGAWRAFPMTHPASIGQLVYRCGGYVDHGNPPTCGHRYKIMFNAY